MINKSPAFKGLNIIPIKGRGFINNGCGLGPYIYPIFLHGPFGMKHQSCEGAWWSIERIQTYHSPQSTNNNGEGLWLSAVVVVVAVVAVVVVVVVSVSVEQWSVYISTSTSLSLSIYIYIYIYIWNLWDPHCTCP